MYLVGATGPLALLPAWFLLTHLHANAVQGPSLTLSIMLIVWAADVGGHFVGGNWGRVKLAPRVSPAKTWEGVIGGMALATLFAFSAGLLLDLPAGTFVVIGVAAALVSVIGDLTVSMLKRNVSVKDSGWWLPGHGGILDRIDGPGRRRARFLPRARRRGPDGMNESEPAAAAMVRSLRGAILGSRGRVGRIMAPAREVRAALAGADRPGVNGG